MVNSTHRLRNRLLTLSRSAKQAAMVLADLFGYAACAIGAVWLVAGVNTPTPELLAMVALSTTVAIAAGWIFGFYKSIVRFMGGDLLVAALKTAVSAGIVLGVIAYFLAPAIDPARLAISFAVLSLTYLVSVRTMARLFLNRKNRNREQVIIYGAGDGGARLITALFSGDDYLPVAVIDDKPMMHGKRIQGLEVFPFDRLGQIIESTQATGVLLAVPSASRFRRRQLLEKLEPFPVHVQTMPEISDLVTGKLHVDDLREVDVKDILGRDAVPPRTELLNSCITGKSVLVTGAGGSIGSELCRQIIALRPERLVLFDMCEPLLYSIAKGLEKINVGEHKIEVVPLLGTVQDEGRIREVFDAFDIETVYHAAAYKHVPIVEYNLLEGIRNNVFGTMRTARAAIDFGVKNFVLVSTDKAVNPTSAMGATKRLAELVLQALNTVGETRFCMVRFGNVLESSGSVVPLFREQIRNGGPVTVTHRDIIRYFMTIPEAAQLVLQAGSMAQGGDVFVLEMGEPVKIDDLARRMIHLMGLTVRDEHNPDGDIEIEYIGLRPAEKLYEELLIGTNVTGTSHPRIMCANEECWTMEELAELLGDLNNCLERGDPTAAKAILHKAVREYDSKSGIHDLVWLSRHAESVEANTIVDFPKKA